MRGEYGDDSPAKSTDPRVGKESPTLKGEIQNALDDLSMSIDALHKYLDILDDKTLCVRRGVPEVAEKRGPVDGYETDFANRINADTNRVKRLIDKVAAINEGLQL